MLEVKDTNGINKENVENNLLPKYNVQAEQFANLKKQCNENCIKMAEILSEVKKEKYYKEFLKDKRVGVASAQAKKYIRVYNYYKEKKDCGQPTIQIIKLGIEKTDVIAKLKNKKLCPELEEFVLNNNVSVSKLKLTVNILNQNNEYCIEVAYNTALEQKKQKKIQSPEKFNEQNAENIKSSPEYKALEEKCRILEAENQRLNVILKQSNERNETKQVDNASK